MTSSASAEAAREPLLSINIAPFVEKESFGDAQRAVVLEQVRRSCLEHGFFIITGHGIASELQQGVLEQARTFFDLPRDEKMKVLESTSFGRSHRGYQALQETLMRILATTLGVDYGATFEGFMSDSLRGLRLLHYPPQDDAAKLGAGAHTDFGALTVLLTEGVSGLQILDEAAGGGGGGEWVDVEVAAGSYIVNLGDMMKRMTAGLYKSSVHRVLNTSGRHRYSVPCFLDGNLDFVVRSVVEGPEPRFDRLTVEEHMMERFQTSRDALGTEGVAVASS
ncbi:2og-Fe oxygenase family protein [Xylariomycetidae sp. FL2044]|nr:2og-Fe oxygenase family protein [Xylariomycetidae sp. FL2044]